MRSSAWIARLTGAALAAIIVGAPMPGQADRLRLDNGRQIEGVIEAVTERHVLIRVGGGRIRFDRDRVKAIEHGDSDTHQDMMEQWQRDHFLAPRFVPNGLKDLAAGMRRLLRQRNKLADARQTISELEARERALLKHGEALQQRIAMTQRQLAAAKADHNPVDYNRRVAAANQAGVAWKANQRDIESVRDAMAGQQARLSAYMRDFDQLVAQHHEATRNQTADHTVFLETMQARLERLRQDFNKLSIQTTRHGSVNVIQVRVNNRHDGRFIVDTGAGTVTLSAAFAAQAGIPQPPPETPTVQVVLADGRRVEAHPVLLDSLQVADHTERQVAAVILPEPPADNVDGLLGMSFLRRFHVSLEPSGNLILRRFTGDSR